MRNRLLEDFSEEEVLQAAKKYLKLKLGLEDDPIRSIIDSDSLLLIYEDLGEDAVSGGIEEDGIDLSWVLGINKEYCWIEFDIYDGLKRFIASPKPTAAL